MAYFKPYIDETGYHYPTYNEILERLIDQMQTIYGSGIYLGNDSPDYEMLSVFAEFIFDTYQTGEILYMSQSMETAIGAGLDYQVALLGIRRKQPTKSTAALTITGTPGTVISGGVCADTNGYLWDIDGVVTIDESGAATATAYCREYGFISALPNTITRIMTPTLGWESVTNESAAEAGTVVEKDSELRGRAKYSTALPSKSMLDGLRSAILAENDVVRCAIYENKTHETDANGIPPNSVCCVIEGGDDQALAEIIWKKKGLGCGLYGGEEGDPNTVKKTVVDAGGNGHTVSFARLSNVEVAVEITVHDRGGYSSAVGDEIKLAVVNYLSTFGIGIDLDVSSLWGVIQGVNGDLTAPRFSVRSVKAARGSDDPGLDDVVIGFNEAAHTSYSSITITLDNS